MYPKGENFYKILNIMRKHLTSKYIIRGLIVIVVMTRIKTLFVSVCILLYELGIVKLIPEYLKIIIPEYEFLENVITAISGKYHIFYFFRRKISKYKSRYN